MSKREDIAKYLVEQLEQVRYIKNVSRNPINATQLPKDQFPYVVIESANEVREPSSFSNEVRQVADIDYVINVFVSGDELDSRRNDIMEEVEKKLQKDSTLNGNAYDSYVSEIQVREIENNDPFAQSAMVYTVRYFYKRGTP